jgi:hypothetical protein
MGYRIIGAVNTRELRGSKMVRVREYQAEALPSETYFQFRREAGTPCFANPRPCAENISARIEGVLANPLVTDVVYSQDTTPGGRLLDLMTTYYSAADGTVEGAVELRLAYFTLARVAAAVEQEIGAQADNIDGGGGSDVVVL